jgi:hypothetical protein
MEDLDREDRQSEDAQSRQWFWISMSVLIRTARVLVKSECFCRWKDTVDGLLSSYICHIRSLVVRQHSVYSVW